MVDYYSAFAVSQRSICPTCGEPVDYVSGQFQVNETRHWFGTSRTYGDFIPKGTPYIPEQGGAVGCQAPSGWPYVMIVILVIALTLLGLSK